MPSTYTSFALVGATGLLGKHLLQAFTSNNIPLVVITRSTAGKTLPTGVKVEEVPSYDDVEAVASVLRKHKVEVIISAVGRAGLEAQIPLADASKSAGVKLFVPSEFGAAGGDKAKYTKYLESIGLPSLRIYNGTLLFLLPVLTSYNQNGKFNIIGEGDKTITFTAETDVAGFLVHILTSLPPSALHDKLYRIEGDRITFAEAARLYNAELVELYASEVVNKVPDFVKFLLKRIDDGAGTALYDLQAGKETGRNDNALWVGHEWKKVKDTVPAVEGKDKELCKGRQLLSSMFGSSQR